MGWPLERTHRAPISAGPSTQPIMNFLPLLGWLAVLMTAVGSYRLTTYLYRRDPLYATLTGGALTLLFVAFFESVLLATGVLAILLPAWYVLNDGEFQFALPRPGIGGRGEHANRVAARARRAVTDARERIRGANADWLPIAGADGNQTIDCPHCGQIVEHGDQYCNHCGLGFQWHTGGGQG